MGVALPRPGISAFHWIFVVGLHRRGGFAFADAPVASGPRQWCQLSKRSRLKSWEWAAMGARVKSTAVRNERRMMRSSSLGEPIGDDRLRCYDNGIDTTLWIFLSP